MEGKLSGSHEGGEGWEEVVVEGPLGCSESPALVFILVLWGGEKVTNLHVNTYTLKQGLLDPEIGTMSFIP